MRKIYGIDLRGECFTVAVICIRRRDEAMGEMRFQMLLRMAEQQIAQQISDVPEADLFNMENARYVLLFSSASPFDSVRLSELLEQIASALERLEGVDVYIGKGVEVRGLEHVRDSYHSADAALDYREMFKNDHVYDIVDFRKDASILEVQSHLDAIDAKAARHAVSGSAGGGGGAVCLPGRFADAYTSATLLLSVQMFNAADVHHAGKRSGGGRLYRGIVLCRRQDSRVA